MKTIMASIVFFFPLPIIKTMKTFGPAYGEGNSKAEAQVALAKNLIQYKSSAKEIAPTVISALGVANLQWNVLEMLI